MKYTAFEYLWPPRPDSKRAVPANGAMGLSFYEKRGWVGQYKKNGTCNVIAISPDKEMIAMSRHNDEHKLWSPSDNSMAAFKNLPGKGWYVFVAELLHSKVPGIRDTNYLFDILVADGDYLIGKTFMERQHILNELFPETVRDEYSHRVINDNTWIAKLIDGGFRAVFNALMAPEDEGLVLKNPKAKLELCSRPTANTSWQVKCRVAHKNFSF